MAPTDPCHPRQINNLRNLDAPEPGPCAPELSKSGLRSDIEIGPVYHRLPRRIRAHALVCFLALILHRVLRMRLKASQRPECPARLLEHLRRVQQQTARTADGQMLRGLTELGGLQKDLFAAFGVARPSPTEITQTIQNDAPASL